MPVLATQRNGQLSNGFYSSGFWSKHCSDDVSYNQLQKFWSELSPQARENLLRMDKQTLFEQARKKMYCSRCNGLLLEGFMQIVMYGKSLQQEGGGGGNFPCSRSRASKDQTECGLWNMSNGDEIQDPSVHPWGGLTATRDGSLTLLDCYLYGKSLKGLQNVFDSARGREQERELLYPDACGGAGRGWMSQGMVGYGRGRGTREACALHTARLSCDTLVDFWSALGDETQQSLLRMKEEDFIERLMYRFDSKRFCRDCRRNVIREFKELKELKRMRRETRCTSCFCVADTAFQYEVSDTTVQADWCQTFPETFDTYHHFEWAMGTGEGKSDIVGFENVGMSRSVKLSGLDLGGLSSCFITLRAWKMDGRFTELSVKAHALKGQQCVHCRLVVGDGFVTINRGESIRHFFEHAEEAEEEEDDDSLDKDGNDLDGECSRPQKHAKSPELAREFLLDAATVIFKEQVEKAFREGTARQNAHSIFVCLALKLLEERVHVACKEIITLEKQMKLLEEEEKEKREEEERKERKRAKEREKKLRRKERLKGKDKVKEEQVPESNESLVLPVVPQDVVSQKFDEESASAIGCVDSVSETGDLSMTESPCMQDKRFSNGYVSSLMQKGSCDSPDWEGKGGKDGRVSFKFEEKFSHPKKNFRRDFQFNSSVKWSERRPYAIVTENGVAACRFESRNHGDDLKTFTSSSALNRQSCMNGRFNFDDKFHCPNNKMNGFHSCSCHPKSEYRGRSISSLDMSKHSYQGNRYCQLDYKPKGFGRLKNNSSSSRDVLNSKKVWEPVNPRCNSDTDVILKSSTFKVDGVEPDINHISCGDSSSTEATNSFSEVDQEEKDKKETGISSVVMDGNCRSGGHVEAKERCFASKTVCEEVSSCPVENCLSSRTSHPSLDCFSSSDNCSSCLSEGDSSPSSSNLGTLDSSSTSDSEDCSHQIEGREALQCTENGFSNGEEVNMQEKGFVNGGEADGKSPEFAPNESRVNSVNLPTNSGLSTVNVNVDSEHQLMFPAMHNQNLQFTMFQAPPTYFDQNHVSWPTAPTNRYVPFPSGNHYLCASPLVYPRLCVQYGPVQHVATPLFNSGSVQVCQPDPRLNSREQMKTSTPQEVVAEANSKSITPTGQFPAEKPVNGGGGKDGNPVKLQPKGSNFSLFHSGGPIEISTCKLDSKDEVGGVFSSKISGNQVENDASGNKASTMEEYSLFAASKGISFSIS